MRRALNTREANTPRNYHSYSKAIYIYKGGITTAVAPIYRSSAAGKECQERAQEPFQGSSANLKTILTGRRHYHAEPRHQQRNEDNEDTNHEPQPRQPPLTMSTTQPGIACFTYKLADTRKRKHPNKSRHKPATNTLIPFCILCHVPSEGGGLRAGAWLRNRRSHRRGCCLPASSCFFSIP